MSTTVSKTIGYDIEPVNSEPMLAIVFAGQIKVNPELPLKLAAAESAEFERQEEPKKDGADTWRDRAIKEPIFW